VIVVDGDSATLSQLEDQRGWPGLLGYECLAERESTVLDGLLRLERVRESKPERYLAQFGTWSAYRPSGGYMEPLSLFADRLAILVRLAARLAPVILLTPPPLPEANAMAPDNRRYADCVRAVACETGARLIDVAARLTMDELRGRAIDYLEGDIFNHQGPGGHTRTAELVREVLGG
jgi:hypothetical protein